MKNLIIIFLMLISKLCWGHSRLIFPLPRDNNAGIKAGPCGGLAKSATPTVVQAGQMLTVQWEETINHPGRFIFSLSNANDLGFQQNILATIVDDKNVGVALPHRYQAQIMMPNIDCPSCTLQMIQSMEENPAAPSYYYSCSDINIKTSGAVPTPNPNQLPDANETIQSSTMGIQQNGVEFGKGCGTVKSVNPAQKTSSSEFSWMLVVLLTMLIPGFTWLRLKARSL
jgi:hypothetical protein